jgi:hypothetical protein
MERTDIHRPSAIVPSDYEYVAVWTMNIQGFGDSQFILQERKICKSHMERTGGIYSHHEHGGSCDVCGNVLAIFLALFYHAKTNEYIRVGVNCAQKLEMSLDESRMNMFRRQLADAREAQAGKRKAISILSDAGLIAAWEVFTAEYPKHAESCKAAGQNQFGDDNGAENACTCDREAHIRQFDMYEERTIRDIVGKLVKYGNVSDAQKAFISKLIANIARRPIIEAERAAEREAAGPVPTGRVEMTGTVLSMKEVEVPAYGYSRFGGESTAWKLLIRLDNGSKVWGSRFANLEKGDNVKFTATVTASDKDAKFGFYKRPVVAKSPEEIILNVFQSEWPARECAQ